MLTSCAQDARDADRSGRDVERDDPGTAAPASAAAPSPDNTPTPDPVPARGARGNVVFVGTSLTAGYGVGESVAYPARIQEMIDSVGLPFRVRNAGISGETSAAGLRRIDWTLQRPADVLVVELGANDGLRGLPVAQMRTNIDAILTRARATYPDISLVILGMEAPPNLGDDYTTAFRRVFTDLAAAHDAALVPFLLVGVATERAFNIEDGLHPNAEGHRLLARTVWPVLEPILRRRAAQPPAVSASSDSS